MKEMTPRERVITTLNHEEPDRVPIDIGGGASTSIVVEGYENLKRHLGVVKETRVLHRVFRAARLDEDTLRRLGSDCRPLCAGAHPSQDGPPPEPGTFRDSWGITWKQSFYGDGRFYWELANSPLAQSDIADLDRYPWPDPTHPALTNGLAEQARTLKEGTEYAIIGDSGFKNFWELAFMLRGYEQLLIDLLLNKEFVRALMEKLLEINAVATGRFLDAVGEFIQIFRAADDLATQEGLLFSPQVYRTMLKPIYKRYFDLVRSKTDAKIFFHSCGNVTGLIDELIDLGVDIINPVQVSAMGDTAALKSRFGTRISFWGAIDTQRILPQGSIEDVEGEVRRRIHDLGAAGGYVLAAVHNIQADVPPENILAMSDAARRFGVYPLSC